MKLLLDGRRTLRAAVPALVALSAILGGCGKATDEKLEARLAALEAKADAADQRSRQALSMAATGNPAPAPEGGGEPIYGEAADNGGVTDDSPDSAIYDNTMESPPGPAIAPGG
ncbi:hypothetical protein [Novosphingobium taihuense]|uniref:Lipoprotein n=2 Tax=Novosphingobium taihuense TaxID=260085 RepID=A0A7W7AEI2_9SPHN|nr:hypothetical protein [Novosphingobium taihuense]MBB4615553.1 hypothetical protein [Novosphingobium taihuense]